MRDSVGRRFHWDLDPNHTRKAVLWTMNSSCPSLMMFLNNFCLQPIPTQSYYYPKPQAKLATTQHIHPVPQAYQQPAVQYQVQQTLPQTYYQVPAQQYYYQVGICISQSDHWESIERINVIKLNPRLLSNSHRQLALVTTIRPHKSKKCNTFSRPWDTRRTSLWRSRNIMYVFVEKNWRYFDNMIVNTRRRLNFPQNILCIFWLEFDS